MSDVSIQLKVVSLAAHLYHQFLSHPVKLRGATFYDMYQKRLIKNQYGCPKKNNLQLDRIDDF